MLHFSTGLIKITVVSKSVVIYASLGKHNGAVVRRVTPQKEGPGFEPTGWLVCVAAF